MGISPAGLEEIRIFSRGSFCGFTFFPSFFGKPGEFFIASNTFFSLFGLFFARQGIAQPGQFF